MILDKPLIRWGRNIWATYEQLDQGHNSNATCLKKRRDQSGEMEMWIKTMSKEIGREKKWVGKREGDILSNIEKRKKRG